MIKNYRISRQFEKIKHDLIIKATVKMKHDLVIKVMEYYLVIKDNDQRLPVYQGNLKKET
jgi:hypothetical protein